PFVPGHEVAGVVDEGATDHTGRPLDPGARVVVEPVLGCAPRSIEPFCPECAVGHTGLCENVAFGELSPGLQTGYCADTGGGWSTAGVVAHPSQIHRVPDSFSDEDAVMVEPTACAVHAALSAGVQEDDLVAVVGAGTLGLLTVAALHRLVRPDQPATFVVGAKYAHQSDLARELGADVAVPHDQLARTVRARSRSLVVGGQLTGGADVVLDCVGSAASLESSLAMVRPRGRVVVVGMPGPATIDLAPLWHREVALVGAYAYGTEGPVPAGRRSFELAFDVVPAAGLGRLVSATYPLERFEEAIAHAGGAGRRGATKIAFDLRNRRRAA
ncbi:MAG TPA: zinc-binding dehydrogenase, partial [Acidimicrobiales bacterium]|nr:zinc-binding dehydrogenase [Acidimicrobiales bacterium]